MALSKMVKGTMLLTGAAMISKVLGILYVIPFEWIVGHNGGALFSYAYIPYTILISISTMGVPLAMSKFVSKYHSLGDYYTARRMFTSGLFFMFVTGFIAFLMLFFGAEVFARWIITDKDLSNSVEDVAFVIQMVSIALIIIPAMSLVRGYFQGQESMAPTAVSQVVEQIARIVFLLAGASAVIFLLDGEVTTAVGLATFAAFIGAIASSAVLWFYWRTRKPFMDRQLSSQRRRVNYPLSDLFKELLSYAGPFVLVGIATPIYQLIDQFTFNRAMAHIGLAEISEAAFSAIVLYGHKLVIIPVTVATGLSLALLPAITSAFTEKKRDVYIKHINQSLQMIMLVTIPAVVGLSLLSKEAYGTFYGVDQLDLGSGLLRMYAPVALFYALFTLTSSILQGINRQNFAVVSLGVGVLIKLILNIPLIYFMQAKGAIIATGLAVSTASLLNLWKIHQVVQLPVRQLIKRTVLIGIFTLIMTGTILILKWLLQMVIFDGASRLSLLAELLILAGAGGYIYLWFSYKSTLLERVLGGRVRLFERMFF